MRVCCSQPERKRIQKCIVSFTLARYMSTSAFYLTVKVYFPCVLGDAANLLI
uniref:Uncharacterized protein n=1 Tax=Klebsiella pneumoniae TaxID=573 RepID=A0A8E6L3X0_KLEPN|nr:hypothetical protein [Klebsiella pneumoniae]